MPVDDETLSKLLRLKRYEQPPPEYFDNFLREFQERQRAEMLRRPAWKIAWERVVTRFEGLFESYAALSYTGASLAVIGVAAAFTVQMLKHPGSGAISTLAEINSERQHEASARGHAASTPGMDRFTLNTRFGLPEVRIQPQRAPVTQPQQPRYILDTRPASYEASYSF